MDKVCYSFFVRLGFGQLADRKTPVTYCVGLLPYLDSSDSNPVLLSLQNPS